MIAQAEPQKTSIDLKEIHHFSRDSAHWWDENGPFKPLHKMNPTRLSYLKAQICAHFKRDEHALDALQGLDILDIGCGGGLICEPMARMGANVTGADADPTAIETATAHAELSGLNITYENKPAEDIKKTYDIVLALEILEHVTSPEDFVRSCANLLKPGGLVIFSTLNRTPQSFALGIIAAEYILRWVPRGTHSWKKFIRPSELARHTRKASLETRDITGLVFKPTQGDFELSQTDLAVNYFITAMKQ